MHSPERQVILKSIVIFYEEGVKKNKNRYTGGHIWQIVVYVLSKQLENKYNQSLVCHLLRLFKLAILSMQFVDNDNFL